MFHMLYRWSAFGKFNTLPTEMQGDNKNIYGEIEE